MTYYREQYTRIEAFEVADALIEYQIEKLQDTLEGTDADNEYRISYLNCKIQTFEFIRRGLIKFFEEELTNGREEHYSEFRDA